MFAQEAELEKVTLELSERTDYESQEYHDLIVRMNEINDRLLYTRSDNPQVQAEKTLIGLGFKYEELSRPTETFSQGWNMRIELAKILLSSPDVLLLDEPTNHLDIESIEWLESYLKDYRGSLVLISHDRKFLDNVTTRTVEIMLGRIHDYKVPYSKYLELRRERISQQKAAYENQQRMIEKTEEFIEKFRYKPTKSNQVQSRVKQLEKLERIEVDLEDKSALAVKFPPAPRSGDIAFKASGLKVGYGTKVVFSDAEIEIRRGEKVALVGRNGEGKTTLMRVIMKELDPMDGGAKIGHNVNIGYYAQNQEDILDKQDTVFGTLDRIAVGDIRLKLRDILAAFLFKGEDIDKKVAVLSGGERARLAMAKLMLNPYNLLALDEPTNHMDIRSKDILKQALQKYDGTLVVVSHDRDFLDGLVDKLYEFRDGKVKEHLGGVQDFLDRRKMETLNELERNNKIVEEKPQEVIQKKEESKQEYKAQKFISKEEKKIRNRISFLEKGIAQIEEKMKEIETVLMNPGPDDDIMDLTREYLENKRELDAKTDEWANLMETIEE
jgi:ATP-binding cassette subfamily F protein 3